MRGLMTPNSPVRGRVVFLSASIPDPTRWKGEYDPFAITDAVVATARVVFTRGGTVLTAAHPTVAPLILQVADGFPGASTQTMVILYQSSLFSEVISPATREMMERDYVRVVWTPASPGDRPVPGEWASSLETMRSAMLTEVPLTAAIFIGGMEGIADEYELVGASHPEAARYALGRPGGQAALLSNEGNLGSELASNDLYPWLLELVMNDAMGPAGNDAEM